MTTRLNEQEVPHFESAAAAALSDDWDPPEGMTVEEAARAGLVDIPNIGVAVKVDGETVKDSEKGVQVEGPADTTQEGGPTSIYEAEARELELFGGSTAEDRAREFVQNRDKAADKAAEPTETDNKPTGQEAAAMVENAGDKVADSLSAPDSGDQAGLSALTAGLPVDVDLSDPTHIALGLAAAGAVAAAVFGGGE